MTLSELANVAEIVGGIAVVASLVYVGVQIRQNTKTVRNSTLQANTALWTSMFCNIAEKGVAEAYTAGVTGRDDIDPVHFTQFFLVARAYFVAFENQYFQFCEGSLDEGAYKGYERSISTQVLAFPGFRVWWQMNRAVFSDKFVTRVDQLIAAQPAIDAGHMYKEWQHLSQAQASGET